MTIKAEGRITLFDCLLLESLNIPEISPYPPDAQVNTNKGAYYIEIQATHAVPPVKRKAMQDPNIPVLEIDLSTECRSEFTIELLVERAALLSRIDSEVLEMPGPKIAASKMGPKIKPYSMGRLGQNCRVCCQ